MRLWIERVTSGALTVAALAIAGTYVHESLLARRVPSAPVTQPRSPERVGNWAEIVNAGTLLGDSAAPIKVVEFGDFECPFCRRFLAAYRGVQRRHGNKIALVFIHFPLRRVHRFAGPAARAATCAEAQGRFAAYSDVLFEKQDSLGLKSWTSYASEAGVADVGTFARCVARTDEVPSVARGEALANRLGLHGTPTVIVNGWRFYAPPDEATLEAAVSAALASRDPTSSAPSSSPVR